MQIKYIKDIKGFEDVEGYSVTSEGDVFSHKKRMPSGKGKFTRYGVDMNIKKGLKPLVDSKGYLYIDLRNNDGTRRCPKVHRLVALAFIENPENKPQINHIDGDKTNNAVSNLEWVTNQENRTHAIISGIKNEINYGIAQCDMEGNVIAVFPTAKKALESLGVQTNTGGNIGRVIRGNRETAYGFKWKQIKTFNDYLEREYSISD